MTTAYQTALTACAIYEGLMHAQYLATAEESPYQAVVDMSPEQGGVELYGLVACVAVQVELKAAELLCDNLQSVWAYDVAEVLGARLHAALKAGTFVSAESFVDAEFPAIWEAANA